MPKLLSLPGTSDPVFGFIIIAALVGVAYWFLSGRTRFGFDLRATGMNPAAAVASGVNAKRMVIATMLLSGAVAGLVGLPELLGREHAVTTSVGGLGFTGIAIALLGRNNPVGIVFAALLWAFLDRTKIILDLNDIPQETIVIMQGVTVLAVVVAYELAARFSRRQQQRSVGVATGEAKVVTPEIPPELAAKAGIVESPKRAAPAGGREHEHPTKSLASLTIPRGPRMTADTILGSTAPGGAPPAPPGKTRKLTTPGSSSWSRSA